MKAPYIKFLIAGMLITQAIYSQKDYSEVIQSLARIDLLPRHNSNIQVRQVSSYDTTGGNDDGFSGKFSFLRKEKDGLVIADLKGPGVIKRIWTPTPTEDTIMFFFDNENAARVKIKFIELFNGKIYPFSRPVVGNEVGGYYCYLPIPFRNSCKIVFKGKLMQFIQIDYFLDDPDNVPASFSVNLSGKEAESLASVIKAWNNTGKESLKSMNLLSGDIQSRTVNLILKPGESTPIFHSENGGRLIGFEILPSADLNRSFKNVLLKATWDNEKTPAINCPVIDFFGYAFGKPSMQSMLLGVKNSLHYCFIPMPWEKNADIELVYLKNDTDTGREIPCRVTLYFSKSKLAPGEEKLYVRWNRNKNIPAGEPYKILEASGRGHYIGTLLLAQGLNSGMTTFFEGDDQCYIDGKLRLHGTGSEDYFNGGWYALPDRWDQAFSLPVHGCLAYSIPLAHTGGYRFYVSDKLPFKETFKLTIEHGPVNNNIPADYTSVAFYYCDRPLPGNELLPDDLLSKVRSPETMEYWLALLPVLAFSEESEIVKEIWTDSKTKKGYEVLKFTAPEQGFIKLGLEVPEEGEYKLFVSYFKDPACGEFEVNQRQIPIRKLNSNSVGSRIFIDREFIGTLTIKEGTNTITFSLKNKMKKGEKKIIALHRIYLEKE